MIHQSISRQKFQSIKKFCLIEILYFVPTAVERKYHL